MGRSEFALMREKMCEFKVRRRRHQIYKYKYKNKNTKIQIQKYKYKDTNTKIQIQKYKYKYSHLQVQGEKKETSNIQIDVSISVLHSDPTFRPYMYRAPCALGFNCHRPQRPKYLKMI